MRGNSDSNNRHPVRPSFGDRGDNLRSKPSAAPSRIREKEEYGVVVSVKGSFAFIQAIFDEDQLYCPEREFYRGLKIGDRVAYIAHTGQKGLYVEAMRYLIPTLERVATSLTGVIARLPERHRSSLGVIELETSKLTEEQKRLLVNGKYGSKLLFRPVDLLEPASTREKSLGVGDAVEFSAARLHDSALIFAADVKVSQSKHDREIQRLLDAGAVREFGVITAVKGNEFGFLQSQDRKDEIYFKNDDVIDVNKIDRLREGMELEFFVISEIVKGKMRDRAIHLKAVPNGTVQLEIVVGLENEVVVTVQPNSNDESPGTAKLAQSLDLSSLPVKALDIKELTHIDLWARCLPDELVCRVGDRLKVNTHYYRPEKLFFAREVKLLQYFPAGRDSGVICALKDGFGFITSESRRADLYFRLNMVVDGQGAFLPPSQLKVDMPVQFDVVAEDSKMIRAVRVQVTSTERPTKKVVERDDRYLLKKDILGVVIRNTVKKDTYGLIKAGADDWLGAYEIEFVDPETYAELDLLDKNPVVHSIELYALPQSARKRYEMIISKCFSNLRFEERTIGTPGNNFSVCTVSKIDPLVVSVPFSGGNGVVDADRKAKIQQIMAKDGSTLQFSRDDYVSLDLGFLQNDLEVIFDIYYDKNRGKPIAKNIRLTDEPVPDALGEQVGVVEFIMDKGDKFGYVRSIPNNEKLLWQLIQLGNANDPEIQQGSIVGFEIRRRGGLRCAANLRVLQKEEQENAIAQWEGLLRDGDVSALILNSNSAVLVDTSSNKILQHRYVSLPLFISASQLVADAGKNKQWEKQSLKAGGSEGSTQVTVANEETSSSPKDVVPGDKPNNADSNRVLYKPKYFQPASRVPLQIKTEPALNEALSFKTGDYVRCSVNVEWAQQVNVASIVPQETVLQAQKKQGTITRHKLKLGANKDVLTGVDLELWNRNYLLTTDVTEISLAEGSGVLCYYVPSSEIALASENSRDVVQQGDQVDFWVVPEMGNYAFGATLVAKIQPKDTTGLNFNKQNRGFNSELKENMNKAAVNLISMAKGPPNDTASGFEEGWREINKEELAKLPWAHLLSHLVN